MNGGWLYEVFTMDSKYNIFGKRAPLLVKVCAWLALLLLISGGILMEFAIKLKLIGLLIIFISFAILAFLELIMITITFINWMARK